MIEWRKITDFSTYSVSDSGIVRNDKSGNYVKPILSTSGYFYVHFLKERKKYTKYIHRLVCQAFLGEPLENMQVDHKNGDKTDNRLENLHWVTVSENYKAYGSEQRAENRRRKVIAIHEDGAQIEFDSRLSAANHFNCSTTKIKYGHKYKKSEKKGWIFELS